MHSEQRMCESKFMVKCRVARFLTIQQSLLVCLPLDFLYPMQDCNKVESPLPHREVDHCCLGFLLSWTLFHQQFRMHQPLWRPNIGQKLRLFLATFAPIRIFDVSAIWFLKCLLIPLPPDGTVLNLSIFWKYHEISKKLPIFQKYHDFSKNYVIFPKVPWIFQYFQKFC